MKYPCPSCEGGSRAVKSVTLRSLLTAEAREGVVGLEGFRFCPAAACWLLYFHPERGTRLAASAVSIPVFQKSKRPERLVCYCFDHCVEEIFEDVRQSGTSAAIGSITEKCRNGEDRCAETNPQGSCCLGNVRAVVKLAKETAFGTASSIESPSSSIKNNSLKQNVQSPKSGAARATMLGAIVAAIAASACCVLPAILAVVGVSGLGAATALEAYRPLFLGITALLLGFGFYLVYRKPKSIAVDGEAGDACGCPAPKTRRAGKSMLWLVAFAVIFFASYPYIVGAVAVTEKSGVAALTADSKQVSLHIEGMTCESCVTKIVTALTETPGVVKASVAFEEKTASITYDPAQVQPKAIAQTVSALDGYTATVVPQ